MTPEIRETAVLFQPSSFTLRPFKLEQFKGGLPPSTRRIGRPSGASYFVFGSIPSLWYSTEARSVGCDGMLGRANHHWHRSGQRPILAGVPAPNSKTELARPVVIAAGVRVDLGRAAELAHHDDQRVCRADRGRERSSTKAATPLVDGRGERVLDRREILGVRIPAELAGPAIVQRDECRRPPRPAVGPEARLADGRPAVLVAHRGRLVARSGTPPAPHSRSAGNTRARQTGRGWSSAESPGRRARTRRAS